jgi:hypothetical protein
MLNKWLAEAEAELAVRFSLYPPAKSDNSANRVVSDRAAVAIGAKDTIGTGAGERDNAPVGDAKHDSGFLSADRIISAERGKGGSQTSSEWSAAYLGHLAAYRLGYPDIVARRWAWERVAATWHRANAPQIGTEICAACGVLLAEGEKIIDIIPQRIRVHAGENYDCLLDYGRRWRKEAAAAMGVPEPADGDATGGPA